jgi:hypothetical protein
MNHRRQTWHVESCYVSLAVAFGVATGVAACESSEPEPIVEVSRALTATDVRILGFENAADWTISSGSLQTTSDHVQGSAALAAFPINYALIESAPLSDLPAASGNVSLRLKLPVQQPNPYWFGDVQMFVNLPSRGIYNQYLGIKLLTGSPTGQFLPVAFDLPPHVLAAVRQTPYNDLRLRIALNVPTGASGPYVLDAAPQGPTLANPQAFNIELFAEFNDSIPGGLADDVFQMYISNGSDGFLPGMYLTGGPGTDTRVFRITPDRTITIFASDFLGSEGIVPARGRYGSGFLIAEPRNTRIRRVPANPKRKKTTTFATAGTAPFGIAALTYDAATDSLFGTDFTGSNLLRIAPDGLVSIFAPVPLADLPDGVISAGAKDGMIDSIVLPATYGAFALAGRFTFSDRALGAGKVYKYDAAGQLLGELVSGVDGIELLTASPGGVWGNHIYMASIGYVADSTANGAVHTVAPSGQLTPVITNIRAMHVAFDTQSVFGGGLFVTELGDDDVPSKVWRVTPKVIGEPH